MADLVQVLKAELSGGGMDIVKALVTAVDTGAGSVTVEIRGADVRVPFIPMGGWQPEVGDLTYVITRRGWGGVAIGKPAPSARPGVPS